MNPEKEQEYVDPEADTEEPNNGEADEDADDEDDQQEEEAQQVEDDEVALSDVLPVMQQMCAYMGELVEAVRALSKPAAPPATEPPPKSKPKPKKKKAKPPSKWGYK